MWCGITEEQLFLRQCNVLNLFPLCNCPLVNCAICWTPTRCCGRLIRRLFIIGTHVQRVFSPFLVKCNPSCLLWPGSTHLRDPRTTSNPSSPSSSPLTPSALGSGVSDPVLNGGLCSAAFCSSLGGKFSQSNRVTAKERESERDGPPPQNTGDPVEATME